MEKNRPLPIPIETMGGEDELAMTPLCSVFRRYLKSKSLKYTRERADVLDAIIRRDNLFEADELLDDIRERGTRASKATIYRTLKLLQEAGIISQTLVDADRAHYRLVYGKPPRDHMTCMATGEIIEFSDDALTEIRDRICKEHGWKPIGHTFQIFAVSPDAQSNDG